jgi:predicted XRE-type DNA-binding protein
MRNGVDQPLFNIMRFRGNVHTQAAKALCISQPRVSALLKGKIESFRLDSLVDMAHRLDLNVSIRLAS